MIAAALLIGPSGCEQTAFPDPVRPADDRGTVAGRPGRSAADTSRSDSPPSATSPVLTYPVAVHAGFPRPSEQSVAEFETRLFAFLKDRRYVDAGWKKDKGVRDTGPYIDGTYYGTHPAVRVFYSPEVIAWLESGRRGPLPDGAIIIKEQYPPPAARHAGLSEEQLRGQLESWTVMVKDAAGSHDGWFWSNPTAEAVVHDNHADFSHPASGFGLYCVRCHASTRSPGAGPDDPGNEFTFASLRNIEGYPGEPLLFRVDDSWQLDDRSQVGSDVAADESADAEDSGEPPSAASHPGCRRSGSRTVCTARADAAFLAFFDGVKPVSRDAVSVLPPETHDSVAKRRDATQEFVTSNQCMSCHAGLMLPYGPTMFVPSGEDKSYGAAGTDISPYGEWRWSPMGLAGRDPIFLAQLESERRRLEREFPEDRAARLTAVLEDTCLKCHGAMGRHQFHCDGDRGDTFALELCDDVARERQHIGHGTAEYGALAREGVSCMVCHRAQPRPQPADDPRTDLQFYLDTSLTGNLHFGPADELYGPFKDDAVTAYPMRHALGITPRFSPYLSSSRMCGSCHTVTLPSVDSPIPASEHDELNEAQVVAEFAGFHHHVEQATYLEWLNSDYQTEFDPQPATARSCQDCHMSRTLDGVKGPLRTRMAVIQDVTYPDAENLASHEDLSVRVREQGYARHNFSGLNLFLLELFDQFDDVLGVRTEDYMTGSRTGIEQARQNFLDTARHKTADLSLSTRWDEDGRLRADVTVVNKTGHRFPTGVGFRRAFVELLVVEPAGEHGGAERLLWSSGRTNSLGVLVDTAGRPLATEFFGDDTPGDDTPGEFQPHHETITRGDQVQIYESLLCDADGRFTTSFLHGCQTRKDNRLLPRGWSKAGPSPASLTGRYLEATYPHGRAAGDGRYTDGSGSDTVSYRVELPDRAGGGPLEVRATLYYQAIPPYFLRNLFTSAPDGEATRRLHFLLSHADFEGTPLENWKLPVAEDSARLAAPQERLAGDLPAITPRPRPR